MSLMHSALFATQEAARPLPMSPYAYGAIALGVVFALLMVVWMFRHAARAYLDGHPAHQHDHGDAHHRNADMRQDEFGQRSGH